MSSLSSLQTLDNVINKALLTIPESQRTLREYDRFLEFAIDGLRFLRLLVTKDGELVIKVTPDSNNRIAFPSDMEEFVALYVPVNGVLVRLSRDNSIVPTTSILLDEEILDAEDEEGVAISLDVSETDIKGLYGYYTVDYNNREIIINNTTRSELLLKYISSGISLSSTTFIPSIYIPAVIAYIMWQDIAYDRTANPNTILLREKMFKDRNKEIKIIEMPSHAEFMDAWNSKKDFGYYG